MRPLYLSLSLLLLVSQLSCKQDTVQLLLDTVPEKDIVSSYDQFNKGGNTSVAHDTRDIYKWSGSTAYPAEKCGYYLPDGTEIPYIKRDRDLGQTFQIKSEESKMLKSITVRLGFGSNVVRQGVYGENVSIQLFKVHGLPVLNDNGSDSTQQAYHGFPHCKGDREMLHERDDYFTGETYESIEVISGFVFPSKQDFGFEESQEIDPGDSQLKGRYLTFVIPTEIKIELKPNQHYAFLVMIDEAGDHHGFTLANRYKGKYDEGHAIRRDGNGVFPPEPCEPTKDFTDISNKKAYESAHFPQDFHKRTQIQPGTNGYPDVDTWRDLFFIVAAH